MNGFSASTIQRSLSRGEKPNSGKDEKLGREDLDESLEDYENLPPPGAIAVEIAETLGNALE